jgi:hypothetical protein
LPENRVKWIRDIIDGKAEKESVVFDHQSFVIIRDWKWYPFSPFPLNVRLLYRRIRDQVTLEDLHLLAVVKDVSLRSLRDFSSSNLPLLKSIRVSFIVCLGVFEVSRYPT